jgi:predicted O-methyltransferase YrrM
LDVKDIDNTSSSKRFLHPGELETLVALVRSIRAEKIIETGVNEGRTARAILDNCSTVHRYTGIDILPGTQYKFECPVQNGELPTAPGHLVNGDPRFRLILKGAGSRDLTPSHLGTCDLMFIDGDHSEKVVEHDSELARICVNPGGLIVWHDYHALGTVDVLKVLHRLLESGRKIYHIEGTWLAFERKPSTRFGEADQQ